MPSDKTQLNTPNSQHADEEEAADLRDLLAGLKEWSDHALEFKLLPPGPFTFTPLEPLLEIPPLFEHIDIWQDMYSVYYPTLPTIGYDITSETEEEEE